MCILYDYELCIIQLCSISVCWYYFLFKPGTHTWVPCSDLGPTLGSSVHTWDPWGPLFNLGPTPGSHVQTWDSHLCHSSDLGPHLDSLFKHGTHTLKVHFWSTCKLYMDTGIRKFPLCMLTKDSRFITWLNNTYLQKVFELLYFYKAWFYF